MFLLVAVLLAAAITSACSLTSGSGDSNAEIVRATSVPTFVATPRLPPTPLPPPTPVPVTNLAPSEVELLVWDLIATCATQVAGSIGTAVGSSLDSTYDEVSATWLVEASIGELGLSLGIWQVSDTGGVVTPQDAVAISIIEPEIVCSAPLAFLTQGLTPPSLAVATTTPEPTPFATPFATTIPDGLVENDLQARLAVWVAVRSCFVPLPALDDFTAHRDLPQRWVVEGRTGVAITKGGTGIVTYGLWFVDVETGAITAVDLVAQKTAKDSFCFKER